MSHGHGLDRCAVAAIASEHFYCRAFSAHYGVCDPGYIDSFGADSSASLRTTEAKP
jgi:hypothetical protein